MDACLNVTIIEALSRKFRSARATIEAAEVDMQWWMTRRVERQATRMHEIMDRLDVDAAALTRARQGEAYAEARARCLTCGSSDKCLRWLDKQPSSQELPAFCPNLRLFEQYRKS
jgi:hypothetical protein